MADWIPPYYAKLSKSVNDLLVKKFKPKNELKVINKSTNGVTLESSFGGDTSVDGVVKGIYKKDGHEVEGTFKTVGAINFKASSKQLVPGLETSISGESKKSLVKVEAKYAQPFYAATVDVCHTMNNQKTLLNGSCMIGFDGLSVGLGGQLDIKADDVLTDYNCGAEYTQDDLTVSLSTQKKGSVITASYYQKISEDCNLAASLKMDPDVMNEMEDKHILTVGADYRLDSITNVAIKGDTAGIIGANIQHELSNPCLKLDVGASFDTKKTTNLLAANKFGVACTFGDF